MSLPRLLALIALFALTAPASAGAQDVDLRRKISVTGTSSTVVANDAARLTLGVSATRPTAKAALGAASRSMQRVIGSVKASGVAATDIRTQTISVSKLTTPLKGGRTRSRGYRATQSIRVVVHDIERTGVVNQPTAQQVLDREAAGNLLQGEAVERNPDGLISRIVRADQNAGFEKARGADFGLQYQRETPWGTFTWLTQATFLDEFLFQQVEGERIMNLIRRPTDEGASDEGYYQWKGDSRIDWSYKGFGLTGTVRYYDGFHELDPNGNEHWVSQTFRFDLQGSYTFLYPQREENNPVAGYSKSSGAPAKESALATSATSLWQTLLHDTRFTIGCNNVFDQDPPQAFGFGGNSVGYPGFTYDATGQFVYVRLTKKF